MTSLFNFNELKTLIGDKLPVFNNAPFLVAVPENSVSLDLIQITKDNFEICVGHTIGEIDTAKFSIMISEK